MSLPSRKILVSYLLGSEGGEGGLSKGSIPAHLEYVHPLSERLTEEVGSASSEFNLRRLVQGRFLGRLQSGPSHPSFKGQFQVRQLALLRNLGIEMSNRLISLMRLEY
jgi:hypothetical protein